MGGVSDPLQEARRLSEIAEAERRPQPWDAVTAAGLIKEKLALWPALVQRVEDAERENKRLRTVVDAAYIAKHEGRFEPLHDALHQLDRQALRQEGE